MPPGSQAAQPFSNTLGNSMTFHAFPPVTTTPGYGNINQPGGSPGAPTVYGNINNPGGPPLNGPMTTPQPQLRWSAPGSGRVADGRRGGRPGDQRGEHRRPVIIPYYYGVPYTPYYYYDQPYGYAPEPPEPEAPPPAEQPAYSGQPEYSEPPTGSSSPHLYYVPPQTTGSLPDEPPPAFEPQLDTSPRPKARPVTLLAFKDQTVVAVTEYWLKGEEIHYKRSDTEVGIPIEQLDFALTQRLNDERHVPFTLESRP